MIVVSDTSALYALSTLQKLDLLSSLYGSVLVPPAVVEEWMRLTPLAKTLLERAPWLHVKEPGDSLAVAVLRGSLDDGEAAAIVLALESKPDFLLMDERRGRSTAGKLGIKVKGRLAVLLEGKAAGLIEAVIPLMDKLASEINFRISKSLYLQIAIQANEQ
jgi:predicted nucleic acid-binding protein